MKKFAKIASVAAFAVVAGYGIYTNQKANPMSDLMLANVEALANDESDCHYTNGYVAFTDNAGSGYNCCMVWINKAPDTYQGFCH